VEKSIFSFEFTNGASWQNVYWVVGFGASINGNFYGHLLTSGQINMNNVAMYGSVYNLGGNTLNLNQVTFRE